METTPIDLVEKAKPGETLPPLYNKDRGTKLGYTLLAASFSLYALGIHQPGTGRNEETGFMIFFVHYFLALVYVAVLIYHKALGIRKSWSKENISHTIILLNLFLISAYALNRVVAVFEDSTSWLCVYILLTSLVTLSFRFHSSLPAWINRLQHLVLGSALVFYLYLSMFVANYYIFGGIGILAFGIGAHVFVPIFFIAGCLSLIHHAYQKPAHYWWTIAGATATVTLVIAFTIEWQLRINKIETLANQSVMYQNTRLPLWVTVGQRIKNDWISQRILKSDLVYTTAPEKFGQFRFIPRPVNWEEMRKHDPLVFLASLKAKSSLSEQDRITILKAISDVRHRTQERLWSGDNLTTSYIVSDVDIYTDLRLAYTEKYLNVRNNGDSRRRWLNSEEAIYTFQLPEGSVITSLSLWVSGEEEKGILTTKQKATNAYKTIVGVEQRDPSVVHWQEGNTVSVRVFPCTPQEERKFKIGITSPLGVRDGKSIYKNITFRGPNASQAKETTRIRIIGTSKDIELPRSFTRDSNGGYVFEHPYDPDLEISFKATPLEANRFTFNGSLYSMTDYHPKFTTATMKEIYLDINNSWKRNELERLKTLMKNHHLYVYKDGELIKLLEDNWSSITNALRERNFSLFPFHLLKDTEQTLVITKGKPLSPHLSDFKDSEFAQGISLFFADDKKVQVYNLSGGVSTYISSLRELRKLEFAEGDTEQLKKWLASKTFPRTDESDEAVVIHDAALTITKRASDGAHLADNAPDHLARLFAYNNIMRKVGVRYFNDDFTDDALSAEASAAYVVSPVSSLIVLETEEDYERFDIHDQDNSLHNASKQSSGAVPEPHEWALIIMFVLFVIYVKIRH